MKQNYAQCEKKFGVPKELPEFWLFDLDNTLYPADSDLFSQVDDRMGSYISKILKVDRQEARVIQKNYYMKYGTTLSGLIQNHGIDADAYLDYVHQIDLSVIDPSPTLNKLLKNLPGKKYIFTNGSVAHAEKVMARLGISERFAGIQDIKATNYIPKPNPLAYSKIISRFGILPKTSVMLDDIPKNLLPAANLGITTVWVKNARWDSNILEPHIDFVTENLADWLNQIRSAMGGA
ncbi:MAG: pyrimidine 5'-nucleotidase [Rhodospirillaceae bacterium]|nr:pyrimidine 5'-nucleotidase [Rhodospirillaceae bacterium]|tara:strand:- start:324 stop:1028 length:705 start_codon:yes stop_codon:yes gene_type:complete